MIRGKTGDGNLIAIDDQRMDRTGEGLRLFVVPERWFIWYFFFPVGLTVHLWYTALFIGLRGEHFFFYFLALFLALGNEKTRRFFTAAVPIWVFGVFYDSMRLIPSEWMGKIHVADLYLREKALFGVTVDGKRLILPEVFEIYNTPMLDLVGGILYVSYLAVFLLFLLYILLKDYRKARLLGWSFCILNVAGLVTFQLYPAAPPWYVTCHGLGPPDPTVPANPAGTLRFDALVGVPFFEAIYRKSPDVFGAMPSLHVANPILIFLYARHLSRRWAWSSFAYAFGVAFSAVYFNHHYLLDIVVGGLYAGITYLILPWGWERLMGGGDMPRPPAPGFPVSRE